MNLEDDLRLTAGATGGPEKWTLQVEDRELRLSNLDRVLYPEAGFTKRDLIDYYAAVAPALLPHLRDRPITLRRFPDGAYKEGFWEKHCPDHRPEWVTTASIESSSKGGPVEYCLINDLPTLVWVANLASIELHVSLATADARETPTSMVFDLDPGEPADILDCAEIALLIRDTLTHQGLESLAKVSGSKGIQVYVPLNSPDADYETTGAFAHELARSFESQMPGQVVSKMKKSLRKGKVLIDWSQNSEHKTTVAVYSVRARATPSISCPIAWETLERSLDEDDPSLLRFAPEDVIAFVTSEDPFEPVLDLKQTLPA